MNLVLLATKSTATIKFIRLVITLSNKLPHVILTVLERTEKCFIATQSIIFCSYFSFFFFFFTDVRNY